MFAAAPDSFFGVTLGVAFAALAHPSTLCPGNNPNNILVGE
jgi:hypothetical protein